MPLLFAGVELRKAGISGFVETDYLRIAAEEAFTTADMSARNLRLAGLTSLTLPDGRVLNGSGLTLSIGDDRAEGSRASIRHFTIPRGGRVTFAVDRRERRLTLEVAAKKGLHLQVIPWPGTPVHIDGDTCPAASCDVVFEGSGAFDATASYNPLVLRMDLDDEPMTVADRVAVSAVELWELQHVGETVERRGAVKNGSFRLLEAPDQAVTLEVGSVADFEPAGIILRGLEVRGTSIYLQLSGRVKALAVKIGESRRSLMPTVFDWLSHNRFVQVGVGILTLLVGGGLPLIQSLAQRSLPASPPSGTSEKDETG